MADYWHTYRGCPIVEGAVFRTATGARLNPPFQPGRVALIELDRVLSADDALRLKRKWKRLNSRPLYAKGREPRTA